ncbi:MAG TPA: GNAT family N-acetyltransferase [Reyranella sp.]|nr:GNAT family N-acetyltransferase [Reyranella sp.]
MALSFDLRPAAKSDFAFCWPIYRDALQPLMEPPAEWREPDQRRVVERALADAGSSILRSEGADAGWLHVEENGQIILLKQLHLLPAMRNRGLGTSFLTWMKERADRKRKDLNAELATNSPARRLLERLGFKAVTTAGHTLTMRY